MIDIKAETARLIQGIAQKYSETGSVGSLSCAVYDTAWVSMISKAANGSRVWVFPSSFQYILDGQQSDGSWISYGAEADGIMNTAAALLALCRHRSASYQLTDMTPLDMGHRIERAAAALQRRLEVWRVEATSNVGFELVVPTLLNLLVEVGFAFEFPGRQRLMDINHQKLKRFDSAHLYGDKQTSALHSLEAFIGKVDFDRLRHQTRFGSMLASPSSTAAYLIYSSNWDSDSETYLRRVLLQGEGKGGGGVPSAFPTTNFDLMWASGFSSAELGLIDDGTLSQSLKCLTATDNDLYGFAPEVLPDVDDTAKTLYTLKTLKKHASLEPMINQFYTNTHFSTYLFENDPSFSANCNVLSALLSEDVQIQDFALHIRSVVKFLCDRWWNSDGLIRDKWNLSPHYPAMLMSQSTMRFLESWDQEHSQGGESDFALVQDLLIALLQVLTRTMQAQNQDGSWGTAQAEPTAYAILTLVSLSRLPVAVALRPQIVAAIAKGRAFLAKLPNDREPEYLWIEKVTFASQSLQQAYILAALNAPLPEDNIKGNCKEVFHLPWEKIAKLQKLSQRLPLFKSFEDWQLTASLIESFLFLPQLQMVRLSVFRRDGLADDKYFEYIPFAWTSNNSLKSAHLCGTFLREMMIISFLNYQADEYMETSVSTCFAGRLDAARRLIVGLFEEYDSSSKYNEKTIHNETRSKDRGVLEQNDNLYSPSEDQEYSARKRARETTSEIDGLANPGNGQMFSPEYQIAETFRRFIGHVLDHPAVQSASKYDRDHLRLELQIFLLAHVDQIEGSQKLSTSQDESTRPDRTFFDWVRRTGSDHTSCPYSFTFAVCLRGKGTDLFSSGAEKYFAESMYRHLATLCRVYNDIGSVCRDRDEGNLNSFDFREFQGECHPQEGLSSREQLYQIATFERRCSEMALDNLRAVSSVSNVKLVETFMNVTDMFGQIYVEKDIASRMK